MTVRKLAGSASGRGIEMPRSTILVVVSMLLFASTFPGGTRAADGDLDQAFGSGGKVITNFGVESEALCVAVQPDGKIVVGGGAVNPAGGGRLNFNVARYNANGSLDASFGLGGRVFDSTQTQVRHLAVQRDGKILISQPGLTRLNNDGSLDTSFGKGGSILPGAAEYAEGIAAFTSDGKIVVAYVTAFGVERLNNDGSLDTSFGTGGKAFSFTGTFPTGALIALALQPDGKVIVGGIADSSRARSLVARFNGDGSADPSFGAGGVISTALTPVAIYVQPDGKIVIAGGGGSSGSGDLFAAARYNIDGSIDGDFGTGGIVTSEFFGGSGIIRAIAVRSDGKFVAAGSVAAAKGTNFAVSRYNADGTVDVSFGQGGRVSTQFSSIDFDDANGVVFQPDGQIVAVGATASGANFALVRYNTEQDFGLAFDQPTVNADRGTKVRVRLDISRRGGFAGNVTVTPGAPPASGIRLAPDPVTTTADNIVYRIKVKASAPPGTYTLTFAGTDDSGHSHSAALNLVVQ